VPEHISGQFSVPSYGDSEQWLRSRVARLEAQQELLGRAVAELTTQLAEETQAAAAAAPDRPRRARSPRRGRRGDTFLRIVG
jgi:hypothetical protein